MIGPDLRSSAFQVLSALAVPENRSARGNMAPAAKAFHNQRPQAIAAKGFPQSAATGHCRVTGRDAGMQSDWTGLTRAQPKTPPSPTLPAHPRSSDAFNSWEELAKAQQESLSSLMDFLAALSSDGLHCDAPSCGASGGMRAGVSPPWPRRARRRDQAGQL